MALAIIKEDGSGKVDANSYASVADADVYHDGHLYAAAWDGADEEHKIAALVMATRLIDSEYQFGGVRANYAQALQWPRSDCREPDGDTPGWGDRNAERRALRGVISAGDGRIKLINTDWLVPADLVPKAVVEATCEMARELLIVDRTGAPAGEGLKYQNDGSSQIGYDKTDRRPVISQVAQAMLSKYGTPVTAKSGVVRLLRS